MNEIVELAAELKASINERLSKGEPPDTIDDLTSAMLMVRIVLAGLREQKPGAVDVALRALPAVLQSLERVGMCLSGERAPPRWTAALLAAAGLHLEGVVKRTGNAKAAHSFENAVRPPRSAR